MKINARERKQLNNVTYRISSVRQDSISSALEEIEVALLSHGLMLLCEDATPFSAIFCGEDSHTTIRFGKEGEFVENSMLVFSWYKLNTGRWEINCYFS